MFLVNLRDEKFNELDFEFGSMEEASIFVETVLKNSVNTIDVTIKIKGGGCNAETL